MTFFALIEDQQEQAVLKCSITQQIQESLTELFKNQRDEFFPEEQSHYISFNGQFQPDEGEILYIQDFPLPTIISQAIESPANTDDLTATNVDQLKIKAFFVGGMGPNRKPIAWFQAFNKGQILTNKKMLLSIGRRNTFQRIDQRVITLDTKLSAAFEDGKIFFNTYNLAKRIFDLTNYYREATDGEIDEFCNSSSLSANVSQIKLVADNWVRRKISEIRARNQVVNIDEKEINRIKRIARHFRIEIEIFNNNGRPAIRLPDDKVELKKILRLLADDYYQGPVSRRDFISNSKRSIE